MHGLLQALQGSLLEPRQPRSRPLQGIWAVIARVGRTSKLACQIHDRG